MPKRAVGSEPLVCMSCGASYAGEERFCPVCKVPLTLGAPDEGAETTSERHERARKIKPQLAEGRLVRVAGARNQAEAEFIQGLLLEEGVPSLLRRTAGFDVPDMLAAGPRDVMVPASGAATAREVLLQSDLAPNDAFGAPSHDRAGRVLAALLAAVVLVGVIVWLGTEVL